MFRENNPLVQLYSGVPFLPEKTRSVPLARQMRSGRVQSTLRSRSTTVPWRPSSSRRIHPFFALVSVYFHLVTFGWHNSSYVSQPRREAFLLETRLRFLLAPSSNVVPSFYVRRTERRRFLRVQPETYTVVINPRMEKTPKPVTTRRRNPQLRGLPNPRGTES